MKTEFFQKDLEELGLKRTMLQQWIDRGYMRPSIRKAKEGERGNIWSLEDVQRLLAFRAMLKAGFARDLAAAILDRAATAQDVEDEN